MKNLPKKITNRFTMNKYKWYNCNKINNKNDYYFRKEGDNVAQVLKKFNTIQLPPHVLEALGLSENWQKNVSPEFVEIVLKSADKYQDALRKLAKK